MVNGQIILADEVLTPDSSRFWPLETYSPGGAQPSYDKQFVRDYSRIHPLEQAAARPALPTTSPSGPAKNTRKPTARSRDAVSNVNLLDILLVIVVASSIITGWLAGFARVGIGFIATVSGMLFGFWFYWIPADWFRKHATSSVTLANLCGFFAVFFGFVLVGALVGNCCRNSSSGRGSPGLIASWVPPLDSCEAA